MPNYFIKCFAASLLFSSALNAFAQDDSPCPVTNPDVTGPCGHTFQIPAWTDISGWTDQRYYSTIQLADITGDGVDELIARNATGILVHTFNKDNGQWQPVKQGATNAFADHNGWGAAEYYSTIQFADVTGDGKKEMLARGANGLSVHSFNPKQLSWDALPSIPDFSDKDGWYDVQFYSTIQTGDINGDGKAEVFGRGPAAITFYSYDNAAKKWNKLASITAINNTGGWGYPQYYSTIQAGDIDGDDKDEIIARSASGVISFNYDNSAWSRNSATLTVLSDKNGYDKKEYYSTIQTADTNGNGRAELLVRAGDGLDIWGFDSSNNWQQLSKIVDFSNANGWAKPAYYSTIQSADMNGDGIVEILGRGATGLSIWSRTSASAAWQSTLLASLSDELWAQGAYYYDTIQTGFLNGNMQPTVIARGPYGIRTWLYQDNHLTRYKPFGFPAFSSNGQKAAFDGLNTMLGIKSGNIRDEYQTTDSSNLNTRLGQISKNCTNPQSMTPPNYASCTPPSSVNASEQDWTAVSNQILAELFWAKNASAYFNDLRSITDELFTEENSQFPAQAADIGLHEIKNKKTNMVFYNLFSGTLKVVSNVVPFGKGLDVISLAMGAQISSNKKLTTRDASTIKGKYADMTKHLSEYQQQIHSSINANNDYVTQDLGLMTTVGTLYNADIWDVDNVEYQQAFISNSRYQFTKWNYQSFLPTIWADWQVFRICKTLCKNIPASSHPYTESRDDKEGSFSAILPYPQKPCGGFSIKCNWDNRPSKSLVTSVWGEITETCKYQAASESSEQTSWTYGECNLGTSESNTTNKKDGWNFGVISCYQDTYSNYIKCGPGLDQ